ncbi:MAG: hypothetical protein WCK00_13115 [Deltaproteobacteria bacterium]
MDLINALIMADAVRFRPIMLTAAAVVVGSFVMLFVPIFQRLTIAMMFSAVGATVLTLIADVLLKWGRGQADEEPGETVILFQDGLRNAAPSSPGETV